VLLQFLSKFRIKVYTSNPTMFFNYGSYESRT
jgi:hypothetical protein